jgi:amidase
MATVTTVSLEVDLDLEVATVAEVGAAMASGGTTSVALVGAYLERIERLNPLVNAIRCLAPDAAERAAVLDAERADGRVRSPLHGVPILLKDNIDVAGLPTTAGSLALAHSVPDHDADLVVRLREAGAVVIGKTNLTEMANCMAEDMPSGYSSLGGQVLNPYDVRFDPSGSSSGSGAAAALGLATITVGTETDGSILSPASNQSLVGVKPTLGLVPGAGVLPIASSQDCAGPMCRTVADAAALLGALTGQTYDAPGTLSGVRLALPPEPDELSEQEREGYRAALDVLRDRGAVLVEVPAIPETDEFPVLLHEFARDLDAYLARLPQGAPLRSMRELVAWNTAHADEALKFGQVHLETAAAVDHLAADAAYRIQRARDLAVAGEHGIDATLAVAEAVAVVFPGPSGCGIAARAGYPSLVVPAGYLRGGRRPVGLGLMGPARSEGLLLALAASYEEAAQVRRPPSVVNPSLFRGQLRALGGSPATA